MKRWIVGSLVLLLALAAPLAADEERPGGDELLVINIDKDQVQIEDFLRVVSKACGRPMIWDPADRAIRGRHMIGSVELKVPRSEMFDAVRGLLTFYDLVMIPVGPEGYEITLVADARQTSAILKLKPLPITLSDENLALYEHSDGLFVTTTIAVEHMDNLMPARNALARIVTAQNIGNVTEVPDAKAFVVTDFAPNVVAVYRLLRKMDQPRAKDSTTAGRTVAVALEHALAADVATTLSRHFAAPAPSGPSRNPQAIAPAAPTAPRITADERTNRVLVTGDDAEIEAVRAAIALLDTRVPTPQASAALVPLKHIHAVSAANALSVLVRGSPALWSTGGARPMIVAHEDGALLVAASDADMARIRNLVAEMDKEPVDKASADR